MKCVRVIFVLLAALCCRVAAAQVIQFESNGLRYQALTRNGLTVMLAALPAQIRDYSVVQVAISNGSSSTYTLRPEDFILARPDGSATGAMPARQVVLSLLQKASRNDVIRLITAYEGGLYGNRQIVASNGFESRRQSALAELGSNKLKAAATASAVALVQTRLAPGQSTDGAIFYPDPSKTLAMGVIRVSTAGLNFEFPLIVSDR